MEENLLIRKVKTYMPEPNVQKIADACAFAKKAHNSQIRASGEPYYYHPLSVALILADMHLDRESIITALLHDTIEDTVISLEDIEKHFGKNIAKLVDGVTKLTKIKLQPDNIREGENFRKLLMAMSEDIRVLIVKLADRLHNMRTINFLSDKKANRIALETMEIYAPLAERIGMQTIKNELQDLAFARLHPEERKSIMNRLQYLRSDAGYVVDKIETRLAKIINDLGITAEVHGREKTAFSIWQKMKYKKITFEQLSDVIAFRVIVNDVIDCYQVLGIIHAAYHMIPGKFKDYISTPKENGYRSLHTVVLGSDKQKIEIQIRTQEMHEINESGVAAHWSYKQHENLDNQIEGKQFKWVRELIKIIENSESEEFLEHTKMEMYEDQVFCFTPKGEIVALPKEATPVDFAYALHSDLGNTCSGAKINGRLVPLRAKIENGDQIEIITSKNQTPSASWEKFVVTAKAKSEVKRFSRIQQRKEYISLGKSILAKFFTHEGKDFKEEEVKKYLDIFHKKNIDDLFASVGEGTITRTQVLSVIKDTNKSAFKQFKETFSFFNKLKKRKHSSIDTSVPIKGLTPGISINIATCCNPIPGDQIVGIFHQDHKGVTIHTSDCDNLMNFGANPENWIEVTWDNSNEEKHITHLKMMVTHEPSTLATICTAIAKQNLNITNIKIVDRSQDFFEFLIDIEVLGTAQLNNIIASLRSKECVHSIERVR